MIFLRIRFAVTLTINHKYVVVLRRSVIGYKIVITFATLLSSIARCLHFPLQSLNPPFKVAQRSLRKEAHHHRSTRPPLPFSLLPQLIHLLIHPFLKLFLIPLFFIPPLTLPFPFLSPLLLTNIFPISPYCRVKGAQQVLRLMICAEASSLRLNLPRFRVRYCFLMVILFCWPYEAFI